MYPLENSIVSVLEFARQKRGISVAELARRIGIDKKRLWYILSGQRAMRADEFVRLCAFFGLGLAILPSPKRCRVFLAGASPFALKAKRLLEISDLVHEYFPTVETVCTESSTEESPG